MKRREFFNWVGLGLLASSLPVAIAACTSDSSTTASSTDDNTANKPPAKNWQKVGTVVELDKKGQILLEDSPVGAVLVIGTSKAVKDLVAVNPTCTHQGCTVGWKKDQNRFVCPCHDAIFSTDGKVKGGPAQKPLRTYQTKIENGAVFVQPV
ncbi:MAG: ubiquinol-cytochrome c reductase iron-sulfur subunit [Nostocales cyanobacterium]|nr:MAG: ubiquinol-cytochrome c reductase iron-sulfur subunit [Nostocales cyanobacterium]TAF15566.1 MAG: ubiquinol-cytochrome c reductase iron-sulfur subunit [Nostocales cyanobacterium]